MQLYLYSSQDIIIKGNSVANIKAGDIYKLKLDMDEMSLIYPTYSSGVAIINMDIILNQNHTQINFHKLNKNSILCEIKPFVTNENIRQYVIKGASLKLVQNLNSIYIYFNGSYYGWIEGEINTAEFNKISSTQEYGVIYIAGDKKHIILFNSNGIIYCEQYIDNELTKNYIQLYSHIPNVFNVGTLLKYSFKDENLDIKLVKDRGDELKQISYEFDIIYFLEAIKCGRFKYAHNKLSYELKSVIDIDTLNKYFSRFDQYIYLNEEDVYITTKNNKVIGIYHFVVKNNLIDNIY